MIAMRHSVAWAETLPFGAKEVQWLETASGTSVVTGVDCSSLDFRVMTISSQSMRFGWVHQLNGGGAWVAVQDIEYNGSVDVFWGNIADRGYLSKAFSDGMPHEFVYDSRSGAYVDGQKRLEFSVTATGTDSISGVPLVLFDFYDFNVHGISKTSPAGVRFFAATVVVDGVLLRDYIPVRIGDSGCLYDKVTKQIFECESGSFVVGPDKTHN